MIIAVNTAENFAIFFATHCSYIILYLTEVLRILLRQFILLACTYTWSFLTVKGMNYNACYKKNQSFFLCFGIAWKNEWRFRIILLFLKVLGDAGAGTLLLLGLAVELLETAHADALALSRKWNCEWLVAKRIHLSLWPDLIERLIDDCMQT